MPEDAPQAIDLDGAQMAKDRNYDSQDPIAALADFIALRALTVTKLRAPPDQEWSRTGGFGPEASFSLAELLAMMAEHDQEYSAEIPALTAALP
jgi:hypothetical protein